MKNRKYKIMSKILINCDSPKISTGFGNVARKLFYDLDKKHDLCILGINDL